MDLFLLHVSHDPIRPPFVGRFRSLVKIDLMKYGYEEIKEEEEVKISYFKRLRDLEDSFICLFTCFLSHLFTYLLS